MWLPGIATITDSALLGYSMKLRALPEEIWEWYDPFLNLAVIRNFKNILERLSWHVLKLAISLFVVVKFAK